MKTEKISSQSHPKGTIELFRITNSSGASVTLCNIGAGVVGITVPDRNGNMTDIALGYANAEDYFGDGPCSGKTPGRYANRIALGKLTLDGKRYDLPINNGPNHLHGGPEGFANLVWSAAAGEDKVSFTLTSPDGDSGYPGNLKAEVTFTWSDDNELRIDYSAQTDAKTVVNLTNHTYFNLSGHSSGSVLGHKLKLYASKWLPTDDTLIPTGEIADAAGTPMDFTSEKLLGRDIKNDFDALKYGKGYDNCWLVDNWERGTIRLVAELTDDDSGRKLEVLSTQPGTQVYTGNWLAGSPLGKSGRSYNDYDGVAIECQALPDSPNKSQFPSTELNPGEKYEQTIIFRFRS